MADQLVQLITAVKLIGRKEGATIRQLEQELGVSERTVFRLLDKVEESGFPLYDDQDGHEKVWHMNWGDGRGWNMPVPDTSLNQEEQAVLGILLSHIATVPSLSGWSRSLLRKLQYLGAYGGSFWGSKGPTLEFSQSDLSKISQPKDAGRMTILLSAISQKHTCTVAYKTPFQTETKTYAIYPLCCFTASGGLYVYCVTVNKGQERLIMLALERIHALGDDGKAQFTPSETYDIKSLLDDPFGIILEKEWIETDVVLDSKQGWYETQKRWPDGFVTFGETDDGAWCFHIRTRGSFALVIWLLSCAGHVLSISNEKIKADYQETLKKELSLLQS
ncbi:MAG: WYL domain-containing protein [Sphaerochaetaceae bacterium]|nr:WYL domain-containing protein [Spirochaetales bacterium]MDY5500710.1 WYL domain-containing protein [Sphaerochaetaceae bacterium]